jgi:hypothetical protein
MEKNNLADFPRPVNGRIPNFKGSAKAAQRLSELDIFKCACTIKVTPDKPQEKVRSLALEVSILVVGMLLILQICVTGNNYIFILFRQERTCWYQFQVYAQGCSNVWNPLQVPQSKS